ncbi:MAG TPA: hypothetical protein VK464_23930 [Symbiobacteriaceae bacterium]|nr:hypothetical protein [Symbiobacteriaceae bacterium]
MRDETILFSQAQATREVGHSFVATASRTLQDARFYANFPNAFDDGQVFTAAIYAKGTEALTGPIRRVLIPVSAGAISGVPAGFGGGALTVQEALYSPADSKSVFFTTNATIAAKGEMAAYFAVNQYIPQLAGKRILAVNLIASIGGNYTAMAAKGLNARVSVADDAGNSAYIALGAGFFPGLDRDASLPQINGEDLVVVSIPMGSVDPFWNSATPPGSTTEVLPWTLTGLQRFEISAANRHSVYLRWDADGGVAPIANMVINYLAMEVVFCEEQRLIVGGRAFGDSVGFFTVFVPGVNIIPMRSNFTYVSNPVLAAGEYTLVVSQAETGLFMLNARFDETPAPTINAERELYGLPTHEGVQVNLTEKTGSTFTRETTHILPQLSLHTSGGPLTEVHVYGRQAVAQVYGTITATQEIQDSVALTAQAWPQVRFMARRFGNTTVPLTLDSPTIAGSSVSISPSDFDDLDEIIDGWKEITLPFATAPTMGAGTNPQWRWSATGETAGNRWEILGAYAPALSGTPGNLLTPVPSPNQLSIATYGQAISGAQINLGWIPQYAPAVTATVDDQTADAFLIFAQVMPAVTGFSATVASQPVTGIGLACGIDPCCIPTAISYNWLTWSASQSPQNVVSDEFTRTLTDTWGQAPISPAAWTNTGGLAANYDVNGTQGTHTMTTVNADRISTVGSWIDGEFELSLTIPAVATGGSIIMGGVLRYQDANNFYQYDLTFDTSSAVSLSLTSRVGGVGSTLVVRSVGTYLAGDTWHLKSKIMTMAPSAAGSMLYAKAWADGDTEPAFWQASAFSASITVAGAAGIRSILNPGNTNVNPILAYNSFVMQSVSMKGYELQRMDTIDTDWATIMMSDTQAITGFADYEARVGILSSYRIRQIDVYDFAGNWSATVTATIPSPGITGGCVSDGHSLIFTSNERQDGSINLAYSSVWEGSGATVEESFSFPEAGFTQLQAMYNRDFFTAFRPLERGGEQFTRTVLVQAAAISPPTLGDFTALRDMAWDTVNYICVRDEDGNRWFATVLVPQGRVKLNRSLYFAQVTVIEVTDTPTPVVP